MLGEEGRGRPRTLILRESTSSLNLVTAFKEGLYLGLISAGPSGLWANCCGSYLPVDSPICLCLPIAVSLTSTRIALIISVAAKLGAQQLPAIGSKAVLPSPRASCALGVRLMMDFINMSCTRMTMRSPKSVLVLLY